ncbi:DUF6599 family protein [Massilibacteroides sp.]|uniref:DUF6599 family protein n=1 Tax=Massilibacteroides sp. TaxID=2034766 RepID=UPI0026118479|nr:DUF6599 family protein [Massilibacteroides sp.]MDD4514988.1 hypothetical protein [Massilibacteroides sp.]
MKYCLYLLSFFLMLPLCSKAEDITVKRERVFTGTGLYGFMNGGADLFLEYGVQKLTTRDLVYLDEEYILDIYEMPTPEDAFGIYSVHTFKCIEADRGEGINCLSAYQLQCVIGNQYVSLVFTSGSDKAKANADQVMAFFTADLNKDEVSFPEQIAIPKPYSGVVKFLRGQISLSAACLSLATLLKEIPYTCVWLLPSEEQDEKYALICFDNKEKVTETGKKMEKKDVLSKGEDWLYVRIREDKQIEEDYGPFGF